MNRFCSIFSQLLKLFPRKEFQRLVKDTGAERRAKGFASWDQFVAMLFCQLGRAQTLREICGGLRSCEGKLSHLGVASAPSRSTLAYANARRPAMLFEMVFHELLDRCRAVAHRAGAKFRFKNKLVSLDATVIDLCASLFDWAKYQRTKGAVKLHLVLDHDGYLPAVCVITEGRRADLKVARRLRFEPGTILVFDRGYIDYGWFSQLTASGVFFVTRAKRDMTSEVVEHRVPALSRDVIVDQIVEVEGCQWQLRRVELYVPETHETLVFLTNHLELGASTVAAIYQGALADRAFLQGAQAESQDQDLRRHLPERASRTGLDGPDRHPPASVSSVAVALRLVALESRGTAAHESVRSPRSVVLARSSLRDAVRDSRAHPSGAGPRLSPGRQTGRPGRRGVLLVRKKARRSRCVPQPFKPVLDSSDRQTDDYWPGGAGHRTSSWTPGEIVAETRVIELPAAAPPRRLLIVA